MSRYMISSTISGRKPNSITLGTQCLDGVHQGSTANALDPSSSRPNCLTTGTSSSEGKLQVSTESMLSTSTNLGVRKSLVLTHLNTNDHSASGGYAKEIPTASFCVPQVSSKRPLSPTTKQRIEENRLRALEKRNRLTSLHDMTSKNTNAHYGGQYVDPSKPIRTSYTPLCTSDSASLSVLSSVPAPVPVPVLASTVHLVTAAGSTIRVQVPQDSATPALKMTAGVKKMARSID